jgi:hypothetical protein
MPFCKLSDEIKKQNKEKQTKKITYSTHIHSKNAHGAGGMHPNI